MGSPNSSEQKALDREEILRFMVEQERLTKTLRHFSMSKADLEVLLLHSSAAPPAVDAKVSSEDVPLQTAIASSDAPLEVFVEGTSSSSDARTENSKKTPSKKGSKSTVTEHTPTKSSSKSRSRSASLDDFADDANEEVHEEEDDTLFTFEDEEDDHEDSSSNKSTKNTKEEKDAQDAQDASNARKNNRRQSSPRGRRSAVLEPEHYTYQRLLIYTDGAARGNPGESGAGVVLKTPEGEEVGRFGKYLGKKTNNYAEYQAVLLGLHHAREFGANEVTILSDSELLVRQLLGEYRVRATHLRELFDQVKGLLTLFEKYQIKRIGREKNMEADSMANRAIDERL